MFSHRIFVISILMNTSILLLYSCKCTKESKEKMVFATQQENNDDNEIVTRINT